MGGATCLLHWRDASGQQSLTLLADRLSKHFNATPIGRWSIHWKVYRDTSPVSKSGTGKMMHLVNVQGGTTIRGASPMPAVSGGSGTGAAGAGQGSVGSGPGSGGVGGPSSSTATSTGGGSGSGSATAAGGGVAGAGAASAVATAAGGSAAGGLNTIGNNTVDPTQIATWCMIDEGALGGPTSGANAAGDTQPRKAVIVEVEKDMENLVAKLKNLWVLRQHAQVEGYVFDVGDFIVRAGNIMVASTSYKGLLIEFEYLPQMSSINACKPILEEFVQLLLPPGVNLYTPQMLDYPYEQVGLDPNGWSSLHSRFQYSVLFRRQHIL
ncbi:hypothetical protein BGW42_001259 [Actinomortierella wolfii]|nr:hypothetical protein BGW42_001259 [Actinomortierella wolfii]